MNNSLNKKKLHLKIFLYIMLSIVVTLLIVTILLHFSYEKVALSLIYNSEKNYLFQSSKSVKFLNDISQTIALQLYKNPDISRILFYPRPGQEKIKNALDQMDIYRQNNPYIHSIYLFNRKADVIYISSTATTNMIQQRNNFFDQNILEIINNKKYNTLSLLPRIINEPFYSGGASKFTEIYTIIYDNLNPRSLKKADQAVIVNISEKWMKDMLTTFQLNTKASTLIINKQGEMVLSNEDRTMLTNISKKKYVKRILNNNEKSNYFVEKVHNNKSFITYVKSTTSDWTFIKIIPYNIIMQKIEKIRNKFIMYGIIILVLSILLSVYIYGKLCQPVDEILKNLQVLEKKRKNNFYTLKQESLRKLVYESRRQGLVNINYIFNDFDINLDPQQPVICVLFSIDNYYDFKSEYNYRDQHSFKYAIMNIADELITPIYHKNVLIELNRNYVLMLINTKYQKNSVIASEEEQDVKVTSQKELSAVLEKVQRAVQKYLKLSVTTTISSQGKNIVNITELYQECQRASNYKLYKGHHSMIFAGEIAEKQNKDYIYDIEKEKDLIDALSKANSDKAIKIYQEIIKEALGYPYPVFEMALNQLISGLNKIIINLADNSKLDFSDELKEFISLIKQLETIEEINREFIAFIKNIAKEIDKNREPKYDDLLDNINSMIEKNYMDPIFSVNDIAEEVDMSPVYLGRLYKKLTSSKISTRINETRMKKARELLESTDLTNKEISAKVGFSNPSYFYTVFKKFHGITPSQYREK